MGQDCTEFRRREVLKRNNLVMDDFRAERISVLVNNESPTRVVMELGCQHLRNSIHYWMLSHTLRIRLRPRERQEF